MVATILLLPSTDTRLLAPGVLIRTGDGRLGWVATVQGTPWIVFDDGDAGRRPGPRDHLVLAHDGAVVLEGEDRLKHVIGRPSSVDFVLRIVLARNSEQRSWVMAVERLRQFIAPFGTLVVLNENGAEVSGA